MTTSCGAPAFPLRGIWLGSDYLDDVFDPGRLVEDARSHLVTAQVFFDTLVGTGLSGALIIPILALELGVDYALVRTTGDSRHARTSIEGFLGRSWLFVDDHICTGSTFRRVHRAITAAAQAEGHATSLAGSYCYQRALRGQDPVMPATTLCRRYLRTVKPLLRTGAQATRRSTAETRRSCRDR